MKFLVHGDSVVAMRFKYRLSEAGADHREDEAAAIENNPKNSREDLNALKAGIELGINAGVNRQLEQLDARVDQLTPRKLAEEAERTEQGQQVPDTPVAAFTGNREEILAQLDQNRPSIEGYLEAFEAESDQQLGSAAMAAGLATYT